MNNPRPIALKFCTIRVAELRELSSSRVAGFLRERREDSSLVRFHFFPRLPFAGRNVCLARIADHGQQYSWLRSRASLELTAWKTWIHGYSQMRRQSKNQIGRGSANAIEPLHSRNQWWLFGGCVFLAAITWIVFGHGDKLILNGIDHTTLTSDDFIFS